MSYRDFMFKVLLLGEPPESKYRLARNYLTGYCSDVMKLTIGVNFYTRITESNGTRIKLQFWDIECRDRFKSLTPIYCRGASIAFIMHDITTTSIYKNLPKWLGLIRKTTGNIPVLLVGCKLELEEFRRFPYDEGISLVEKYNLQGYVEISTRTGQNVNEFFDLLQNILVERFIPESAQESSLEFRINEYLVLKLQNERTNIYVNGVLFNQCKYLLLSIPKDRFREYDDVESIDEAAERLDRSLEGQGYHTIEIPPETEFWGHCSNLQVWYENDYDTRLLHRNLAFPLLRALADAGDKRASRAFKDEIALRLESGHASVVRYLVNQGYLRYLNKEELNTVLKNPDFMANLSRWFPNFKNLPRNLMKIIHGKTEESRISLY